MLSFGNAPAGRFLLVAGVRPQQEGAAGKNVLPLLTRLGIHHPFGHIYGVVTNPLKIFGRHAKVQRGVGVQAVSYTHLCTLYQLAKPSRPLLL